MTLKKRPVYLSKSRFIAGLQCPKRLYLTVHPPEMPEEEDGGESLPILNGIMVNQDCIASFGA